MTVLASDVSKNQIIEPADVGFEKEKASFSLEQEDPLGDCKLVSIMKHAEDDQVFWKNRDQDKNSDTIQIVDKKNSRVIAMHRIKYAEREELLVSIIPDMDIREVQPATQEEFEAWVERTGPWIDNIGIDHLLNR